MAISFPGSKSNGQKFTAGNKSWTWNGASWKGTTTTGGDATTFDSLDSSQFLRSDTSDVMNFNTTTGETLKFVNNTSGGQIQIGFQQNDTDGLHHRGYIRSRKSSAGGAAGIIEILPRQVGGGTSTAFTLEAGQDPKWGGNKVWHAGNDGSGSGLDADLLDGWHQTEIVGLQSFSDFPLGTLVTTNINSSGTNGDSFVIQVTGKAYGSSRPHTIIAEGYLYNNTVISTGGTNIAGSNFTYLKVMNNNGVLSFWWPRHGYWNSYDVHVRSSSAGTNSKNRVTAITNSSDPSGATKKIQINLAKSWNDANDGSGSGLDADTVDGLQASSFLRSDADDSYDGNLSVNNMIFKSNSNVDRNFKMQPTGTSTDAGISLFSGPGDWIMQLYGNSGSGGEYGFLDANWGGWDIRKIKNGRLYLNGNNTYYVDPEGTSKFNVITATGDITANSDISLKDNITPIPNALDKLLQIRGVTYNRNDIEDNPRQTGVIAQEVETVLPEVVSEDALGIKSVAYGKMVGLLIEAIKEQQARIDALEERLNANNT